MKEPRTLDGDSVVEVRAELSEATEEIARLESELRDARTALVKCEQQATDLQAQLAKADDVQMRISAHRGRDFRLMVDGIST